MKLWMKFHRSTRILRRLKYAQSSTLLHLERNPVVEKPKKTMLTALQALCLGEVRLGKLEVAGGEMAVI